MNGSSKKLYFYVAHGQGCSDRYFPLDKNQIEEYERGTYVNDCPIRGMIVKERAVVKNDINKGLFSLRSILHPIESRNPNTIVFQSKFSNNDYRFTDILIDDTDIYIKYKDIKKPLKVKLDPEKWENDGKFEKKFNEVGWDRT